MIEPVIWSVQITVSIAYYGDSRSRSRGSHRADGLSRRPSPALANGQGADMTIRKGRTALRVTGLVIVLSVGIALAGCAAHGASSTTPVSDASFIGEAEIDSSHLSTAYDIIHKLRPQFLASRGTLSLDPTVPPALPRVYVDEQFYGDATTLRGIPAGTIESMRYYPASQAQYKYGHDNAAGVIAITTKR
jgi:hypothetical protein